MQAKRTRLPRRAPGPRNRGIYYRPQPHGKVGPPDQGRYLDSRGAYPCGTLNGTLGDPRARRARGPRQHDHRPKRILSLEEMRALLERAGSDDYRALFALMLAGGLRIGEALGLIVADLDPDHAVIRVECQLGRDGLRTPLKTEESHRAVDIPAQLLQQ